jgi:hypothetical protein
LTSGAWGTREFLDAVDSNYNVGLLRSDEFLPDWREAWSENHLRKESKHV